MRLYFFTLFLFFFQLQLHSQFGPQQIISSSVGGTSSVIAADLNGDGDTDVIAGSFQSRKIVWHENMDGHGNFGAEQVIVQNANESITGFTATDINGNGDLDILAAISGEYPGVSKIVWFENLDGLGNFGSEQIISLDFHTVFTIIGADIDNDSDMDVVIIDRNSDTVAWFENIDGLGSFGPKNIISTELDWPIFGVVGDIDNDGDIDILASGYDGNQIGWFENLDGLGTFSNLKIISTDVNLPFKVFLADIDMDGDLDVVSTSLGDNKIAWYENLDGQGTFGPQIIITEDVIYPRTLFVADIDNDGDMDIITSFSNNFNYGIVWLENIDGLGTFANPVLISDEIVNPKSVFAIDLDQDQDIDVLSSSSSDYKIAWYENLTILSNPDFEKSITILYPNPVNQTLYINSDKTAQSIKIFNQIGQLVLIKTNKSEINIQKLRSGLYLVQLFFQDGTSESHKFVKE